MSNHGYFCFCIYDDLDEEDMEYMPEHNIDNLYDDFEFNSIIDDVYFESLYNGDCFDYFDYYYYNSQF